MQVLANDFRQLWVDCKDDYLRVVAEVGQSGWYILGNEVSVFEKMLASQSVCRSIVGCANGMDAIEIALRVLGISPGDKVLTTPLSAFATGLAIMRIGAVPVYCDVDQHGALDPNAAAAALATFPDIRCIVPVHLYGHMADVTAIAGLARQHGIPIIEDAAQAIGASRDGVQVGADGRMACYSFYPTKNLGAVGDGGALALHDADHDVMARAMRNYGQTEKYVHDVVGLNSRLDELHAATLGKVFLPRLNGWIAARRRIAKTYLAQIANSYVTLLPGPDHDGSVWHLFPIMIPEEQRDKFQAAMQIAGIQVGLHYPILIPHQKAVTAQGTPLVSGTLQRAESFARQEVSLPIHPYLNEAQVNHVIATLNAWEP